jgi:hypothetical protein
MDWLEEKSKNISKEEIGELKKITHILKLLFALEEEFLGKYKKNGPL